MSGVSLACYEKVGNKLRTCEEEVTAKLLSWNLALALSEIRWDRQADKTTRPAQLLLATPVRVGQSGDNRF